MFTLDSEKHILDLAKTYPNLDSDRLLSHPRQVNPFQQNDNFRNHVLLRLIIIFQRPINYYTLC